MATTTMAIMKLVLVLTLTLTCLSGSQAIKTVKIFIMAGGANVEGRGSIPELHNLAIPPGTIPHDNSTTANAYGHLVDDDGKWVIRDDVFITYERKLNDGMRSGPLSVKGFGHTTTTFGPDVEFGNVMGNSLAEDRVVIVKAGWNHKTLAIDFRPPSVGASNKAAGPDFLRIVSLVRETIADLRHILGDDYAHAKVDIGGLVWWQGYDDVVLGTADEYESNLQHFIRDIRTALEIPHLPVLITELGAQGTQHVSKEELDFRAMQQRVVNSPEFKGSTKYVHTAKFCVDDDQPGTDDYTSYHGRAHTVIAVGRLMAFDMTQLSRSNSPDVDEELMEVDVEHVENNLRIKALLFFGFAMFGFVVFVAFTRGGLSQARLLKAWKDTVLAIKGIGKEKIEDDVTGEEFSIEMREDRPEETVIV
jgi:hypothetical protein